MNKKILLVSILIVFMFLAISMASAINTHTAKCVRKESPLFGIRTRQAIREKIGNFLSRFVGERVFFLPLLRCGLRLSIRQRFQSKSDTCATCITQIVTGYCGTCDYNTCDCR